MVKSFYLFNDNVVLLSYLKSFIMLYLSPKWCSFFYSPTYFQCVCWVFAGLHLHRCSMYFHRTNSRFTKTGTYLRSLKLYTILPSLHTYLYILIPTLPSLKVLISFIHLTYFPTLHIFYNSNGVSYHHMM